MDSLDEYPVVTEPSESYLNQRQLVDYRSERENCLEWLLTFGKNPDRAEGYSEGTVKPRCYRMDRFYRFVWDNEGGYTTNITHDHADAWMKHLAQRDVSNTHKNNCLKWIKMLYKWRHHEHGLSEWEPSFRFSKQKSSQPRDYLTREERGKIRDASLEYSSIPTYHNVNPAERDRWKRYLAQRFGKPKSEVTQEDWERANGWKIPSLVWTCMDAGLRPTEVERAVVSWVDTENGVLRIPKEDSAKNTDNWVVELRDRTALFLERWLEQRETYSKYEDTNLLWMTREENPYSTHSLRHLLRRQKLNPHHLSQNKRYSAGDRRDRTLLGLATSLFVPEPSFRNAELQHR